MSRRKCVKPVKENRNSITALASAVLLRAKKDMQLISISDIPISDNSATFGAWEIPYSLGFDRPHDELTEFFNSKWCEWLCDAACIDIKSYLEKCKGGR